MKSKISCFNKGILINNIRTYSWVSIVYFIFLFLMLPLKIVMINENNNNTKSIYRRSFYDAISVSGNFLLYFSMFVVPVVLALLIFRYLQSKRTVDMMHSMPIRREELFSNQIIFGLLSMVIPLVLTYVITIIVKRYVNYDVDLNMNSINFWLGINLLFSIFIFLFCIFIGMLTGLTTAQGVLTYIFMFLPAGFVMLFVYNIKYLLVSFPINYYFNDSIITKFSPLTRIKSLDPIRASDMYSSTVLISNLELTAYIFLSLLFLFGALFLYKKRNLETATEAVSFKKFAPVLKYGVTICAMLTAGSYFASTQNSYKWLIFGYVFGSVVGYVVIEMFLNKSFNVYRNLKGLAIYLVIMTVVLAIFKFDVIGYNRAIPVLGDVESVYIMDSGREESEEIYDIKSFKESRNIELIYNLNEQIVKEPLKSSYNRYEGNLTNISIVYKLKSGRKFIRNYMVDVNLFYKCKSKIINTKEGKIYDSAFLYKNGGNFPKISVRNFDDREDFQIKKSDIKEFVELLKAEYLSDSFDNTKENIFGDLRANLYTEVTRNSDRSKGIKIPSTFTKTIQWLKDKYNLKDAFYKTEDINTILISKRFNNGKNSTKEIEIKDKAKIKELLELKRSRYEERKEYYYNIKINNKNGTHGMSMEIPKWLEEEFK